MFFFREVRFLLIILKILPFSVFHPSVPPNYSDQVCIWVLSPSPKIPAFTFQSCYVPCSLLPPLSHVADTYLSLTIPEVYWNGRLPDALLKNVRRFFSPSYYLPLWEEVATLLDPSHSVAFKALKVPPCRLTFYSYSFLTTFRREFCPHSQLPPNIVVEKVRRGFFFPPPLSKFSFQALLGLK